MFNLRALSVSREGYAIPVDQWRERERKEKEGYDQFIVHLPLIFIAITLKKCVD